MEQRPSPAEPTPEKALDLLDFGDVGVLGVLIPTPVAVLFEQNVVQVLSDFDFFESLYITTYSQTEPPLGPKNSCLQVVVVNRSFMLKSSILDLKMVAVLDRWSLVQD